MLRQLILRQKTFLINIFAYKIAISQIFAQMA